MSMMEQDELREILEEFFTEASESLDQLEQDLIELENIAESGGETDTDMVDRIFRVLHTLKGGAGFLGLEKMAKLAHAGENLLDEVRGGRVTVGTEVMDALLETNDGLKELLDLHKADEDDGSVDHSGLISRLEDLACVEEGGAAPAPAAPEPVAAAAVEEVAAPVSETSVEEKMPEPVEESIDAGIDPSLINQELLAEVQGDESLNPELDTGADDLPAAGAAAVESAEPVPSAPSEGAVVNQDLLAEIEGDPSLDPSLDTDAEELVAEAAKTEEPVEESTDTGIDPSLINQELLAEVQGDESLNPELDAGDDEPAAAAAPAETATPAPEVAATPEPIKKGEKPEERRQEQADTRRQRPDRRQATGGRRAGDGASETIRVEVDRLDKVMNLVGELVLARNGMVSQLNHPEARRALDKLENLAQIQSSIEQLSRVTQDLQMSVLSTRMQPIKKVFDKIPRQVRDLKGKLNREVDLVIEGEMTEVDKSLVEELSDPMVHMIRNALDHGIEPPEERKAEGKHPTGSLSVRAFYEGNNVVVQVQEDGKGIDPQKIRQIAVKKGVVTEEQVVAMSDEEAVRLILAPGFSTAETISDVSGRGVGMDVVNSKIMNLKGTLDIKSELGVGTTFSIYLPLTLAIVQALVVASNKEGFAIPIGDISEVIKFRPGEIHKMNDQDVIELRGEALPLYYLSELTKTGYVSYDVVESQAQEVLPESVEVQAPPVVEAVQEQDAPESVEGAEVPAEVEVAAPVVAQEEVEPQKSTKEDVSAAKGFVVVVRDGTSHMGLVVDQLIGQEEAVVKPVTEMFEFNKAVSGATITGDGHVHMILDVPYMLKYMSQQA